MQKYQVIARKYRPQNFKDVVGQNTIVTTLKNALKFQKIAHAYLFCGGRGSGKTTLARLFAKSLNCQNLQENFEPCNHCSSCLEITSGQSLDVIEIDGASNRGIDDIRQINENVGYVPSHGKFKIYIIDEVHMLTKEAFNALLKTLEEPPSQAKFFFATTEPHKILPTIISRCQRFDLQRIDIPLIVSKLKQIALDLQREICDEALYKIAELSDGSLRDSQSLLDQMLCFVDGKIQQEDVRQVFGLVPQEYFFQLDQAFEEGDFAFAFNLIETLYKAGKDLGHFMTQLIDHFRQIAICKTQSAQSLQGANLAKYIQQSKIYTQSQSLYILEYLIQSESLLQKSLCPKVFVENALLHILRSKNKIPVEILIKRLLELENSVKQSQDLNISTPNCSAEIILKPHDATSPPSILEEKKNTPAIESFKQIQPESKSHPSSEHLFEPSDINKKTCREAETLNSEKNSEEVLKASSNICSENTHLIDNLFSPQSQSSEVKKQKDLVSEPNATNFSNTEKPSLEASNNKLDPHPSVQETTLNLVLNEEAPQKTHIESVKAPFEENSFDTTAQQTSNMEKFPQIQTNLFEPAHTIIQPSLEPTEKKVLPIQVPTKETTQSPSTIKEGTAKTTKPQSHYDTIMRFAAVELEGSLKL